MPFMMPNQAHQVYIIILDRTLDTRERHINTSISKVVNIFFYEHLQITLRVDSVIVIPKKNCTKIVGIC